MAGRSVYVVFSHTNTNMGRIIRAVTGGKYNHVSLSLRRDLARMYSFARYRRETPLWGGFVTETPARFLDSGDVNIKVARVTLTDREYSRLLRRLSYFSENDTDMLYNHLDAAASLFNKRLSIPGCYVCFDFVADSLGYGDICTLRQFESRLEDFTVYEGSFSRFTLSRWGRDTAYFEHQPRFRAVYETIRQFAREIHRALTGRMPAPRL